MTHHAAPPLLSLRHIVKRFGHHAAVNDVSLDVWPGQIVALLGENGAGKSTLIKVLAGVYGRDGGEILFKGRAVASARALRRARRQPIAFIHQDLGLVEWMTVAENMALVMGFPRRCGMIDWAATRRQAAQALAQIDIALDPDDRVFDLSRTEKSLLAIARALAVNAEVLVLDEPTASLPADDVRHLFRVMGLLKEKGVGMVYITHRLDEVMEIADGVCAMRDGAYAGGGALADYTLQGLVSLIVGGTLQTSQRAALPPDAALPVLTLHQVQVGEVGPLSFQLRAGEMVALAGLRGAGQEAVGRLLFGCQARQRGEITLCGAPFEAESPAQAMVAGVALVAGDRLGESLVDGMRVGENLFLNPVMHGYRPWSRYDAAQEHGAALATIRRFDVRPPDGDSDIRALSGGNQQKVVLARWLSLAMPLLVLEDPTAGVDVGSRAEIYALLNQALAQGAAIIVISNDREEVAHICNRALVFNRGRIVAELINQDVTFARLLEQAAAAPCAAGSVGAHYGENLY
ncbi:sugar ABC transporter ATP-binding protein [Edwardsiella piscicida]|nr:sugar ABC transporter ATP-binding protein [Edwardsiella piscicida]ELM3729785.1 sugar ABC transporter ATP-binding protein [Edwardsiella piscicida]ELV7537234.1 sugar ABC transporter ATP-binding protein [Edwardsiella piscicida]